jgi:tetratricopeptide (TPR) repeat protein
MYRLFLLTLLCGLLRTAAATSDPNQLLREAMAAQQNGDLEKAATIYRGLIAAYPSIAEIHSNFGTTLAAQGKYNEAITEYKTSLKLKSSPQATLNLALAYYKQGDTASAIPELQRARQQVPGNLQVITLLGDCYLRTDRNKDVIALLTPIQQANPNEPAFQYMLGMALLRDGQVTRAQTIIDPILRDGDSAQADLLMGITKFMSADFSGARDDFAKAITLNPNLPEAYKYSGLALLSTGDQDAARSAFEKALQKDPNDFDANLHLGALIWHDEKYDEALKYLHHALDIRPGDPGVRYQIATIEMAQDRLDAACRDLESLTKDRPNFIEAHASLATVYFRQKRKADGERERAIFTKLNATRTASDEIAAKPSAQ